MKRLFILLALVLQIGSAQAATLTITTDTATDTRLAQAFGVILGTTSAPGVPRNATAAEIKAEVIRQLTIQVQTIEIRAQQNALTLTPISQMN